MKKIKEKRIYELLGVKFFKKFVLGVYKVTMLPFTIGKSKEEKDKIYSVPSNYKIGNSFESKSLKDFIKQIKFNSAIHIGALAYCLFFLLKGTSLITTEVILSLCSALNVYCIMLQRYNYLRIKPVYDKLKTKETKQVEDTKAEIKSLDSKIKEEHLYEVQTFAKHKNEVLPLDQMIETLSLEELKKLKNYLNNTVLPEYDFYSTYDKENVTNKYYSTTICQNKALSLQMSKK